MDWKILSIEAQDGLILKAKYFASLSDNQNTVETEGYCHFLDPKMTVPFSDVTEEMIVEWIKEITMQDGENMIEKRLVEQLESLNKRQETPLPWLPQVFTPEF